MLVLVSFGCGKGEAFRADLAAIELGPTSVGAGGAGLLYDTVVRFDTTGGAARPDKFEVKNGVLPPGVDLVRDRVLVTDRHGGDGSTRTFAVSDPAVDAANARVFIDGDEAVDDDANPLWTYSAATSTVTLQSAPPANSQVLIGYYDPDGQYTGYARLLGFPREQGAFAFTIKAISTGSLSPLAQAAEQPALATEADFAINIGEGAVNILTPTAAEGTTDPAVIPFPDVIDFVNPANPQAFFSFSFLIAGGSDNNINNVYISRELELSAFDTDVLAGTVGLQFDSDESLTSGDKLETDFSDGGWFALAARHRGDDHRARRSRRPHARPRSGLVPGSGRRGRPGAELAAHVRRHHDDRGRPHPRHAAAGSLLGLLRRPVRGDALGLHRASRLGPGPAQVPLRRGRVLQRLLLGFRGRRGPHAAEVPHHRGGDRHARDRDQGRRHHRAQGLPRAGPHPEYHDRHGGAAERAGGRRLQRVHERGRGRA
ncbi:MAG: hypothetical protein ACYTFD_12615, partial [Planctomycetota bacterium]